MQGPGCFVEKAYPLKQQRGIPPDDRPLLYAKFITPIYLNVRVFQWKTLRSLANRRGTGSSPIPILKPTPAASKPQADSLHGT